MIAFDAALDILFAVARPRGIEEVALADSAGRVLAAPVIARIDSPRRAVSAMDGYAVREEDLASITRFPVIGTAYPGASFAGPVGAGQAARVFTGAAVPTGADRVILQENVRREADVAIVETPPSAKRHIRARGSDFRVGDRLLEAGRLLDPRALVAAAGADLAMLDIWRRPRLAVIGTGDELVEPGTALDRPESIPESVSLGVGAFAVQWGAVLVARHRIRDDLAALQDGVASAIETADVVVMTGGASVGDKDLAKPAFGALGGEILFSKVAMMPGKPVWLGRAGDRLVLGLPGNPTSALVTARLFLAPLLAGMGGRDPRSALAWQRMTLGEALGPCGDRETFVRAHREANGPVSIGNQDSGMQLALAQADLLIRRAPHAEAAPAGSEVDVLAF